MHLRIYTLRSGSVTYYEFKKSTGWKLVKPSDAMLGIATNRYHGIIIATMPVKAQGRVAHIYTMSNGCRVYQALESEDID